MPDLWRAQGHVVITGTGRAGTSVLMQILTNLGMETGFEPGETPAHPEARAGFEGFQLGDDDCPYIVKSPHLSSGLGTVLAKGRVEVEHVFVLVRDISEAAASRVLVSAKHGVFVPGTDIVSRLVPGGVWETDRAAEQAAVLNQKLADLVVALATWNVPHTLVAFPRFITDPEYLHERLSHGLSIDREQLDTVLTEVVEPFDRHLEDDQVVTAEHPSWRELVAAFRESSEEQRVRRVIAGIGATALSRPAP